MRQQTGKNRYQCGHAEKGCTYNTFQTVFCGYYRSALIILNICIKEKKTTTLLALARLHKSERSFQILNEEVWDLCFVFLLVFGFGGEGRALCWRMFIWETKKDHYLPNLALNTVWWMFLLPKQMINNISWCVYIQEITNKLDTQNMVFFTISKASHYPPTNLACTTQEEN